MIESEMGQAFHDTASLAAKTTRTASLQTYCTIRLLADRDRVADAYRAYAYFRWVDDWIDQGARPRSEQLEFVERQGALVDACYRGDLTSDVTPEEQMLVDLVRSDPSPSSGLASYIRNMLAVMAFDAGRRNRLISQSELNVYSLSLSIAISEALRYFIGHGRTSPHSAVRHLVMAAHITHMLRDTREDLEAGYFNIPREFLQAQNISAYEMESPSYRLWVKSRGELARRYFRAGRERLFQLENPRFRLACLAYTARFEIVLDIMEKDGWLLRPHYRARKSLANALRMGWSILLSTFAPRVPDEAFRVPVPR
jgi:phytoene/squalene synthetase